MTTRTVELALLPAAAHTVRFYPDLASLGDDTLLLPKTYKITTAADGTGSIALPVKTSGSILYKVHLPKANNAIEIRSFSLAAGSAVNLEDLLVAGVVGSESFLDAAIAALFTDSSRTGYVPKFSSESVLGKSPLRISGTTTSRQFIFSNDAGTASFMMNLQASSSSGALTIGDITSSPPENQTFMTMSRSAGDITFKNQPTLVGHIYFHTDLFNIGNDAAGASGGGNMRVCFNNRALGLHLGSDYLLGWRSVATWTPMITDVVDVALARSSAGVLALTNGAGAGGSLTVLDEAYNSTNWNGSLQVPTKNAVRDVFQTKADGTAGVKIYRALMTVADPPTAVISENSLGGTPTWVKDGAGTYTVTLTGAFTVDKTLATVNITGNPNPDGGEGATPTIERLSADALRVRTYDRTGSLADTLTFNMEILVYP